ncbi:unnamed protein product [Pieris brassicae]|uniref:Uncharacterized protein n=1 Tax=Pieris brassicae TaxID=7116 RepID=A0A9P0XGA8_PIEBR|nr:unnamed protein product [Pieris brassicae]
MRKRGSNRGQVVAGRYHQALDEVLALCDMKLDVSSRDVKLLVLLFFVKYQSYFQYNLQAVYHRSSYLIRTDRTYSDTTLSESHVFASVNCSNFQKSPLLKLNVYC